MTRAHHKSVGPYLYKYNALTTEQLSEIEYKLKAMQNLLDVDNHCESDWP